MRSQLGCVVILSAVALAAACGGQSASPDGPGDAGSTPVGPGTTPATTNLPCSVDKILADNCRKCHSSPPSYGAPMPLVSWEDLQAPAPSNSARKVHELVPERITDNARPMPQPPNARLSAADIATLSSWSASGAPKGTEDCSVTPPKVEPTGVACKPDLTVGPGSAWTMPVESGDDEYVCYGVELSRPTPTHVVGFVPRIDNTKIVHHVVLFEADAASAVSATPTKCSAGGSLKWRMVTGWAPGGKGFELPPEAGFPLKTGGESTHYVVQMHYSNPLALTGQTDKSGFDLCTSAPRKYEADVLAFGTRKIELPPGATVERKCSLKVPSQLAGIHLIASMPHMHKLGTDMSTQLFEGGPTGPASDLGTIAGWNFNTQAWLPIKGPAGAGVVTKTNDVIQTICKYKNTTGAPVSFGENTAEEMCYSFTTYYPRIESPLWSWGLPAEISTCAQ